jgi:putative Holliday junction resolvase
MRKIALDVGDVKIGIAVSDPLGIIANPFETYRRVSDEKDMEYLTKLFKEKQCDTVIIGLPISMDGTMGKRVDIVKQFGQMVADNNKGLKIVYQDERLTTVSAERLLLEADMRRDKRKEVIDKVAASIILRSYLDNIK